jgi:hypothetical protein
MVRNMVIFRVPDAGPTPPRPALSPALCKTARKMIMTLLHGYVNIIKRKLSVKSSVSIILREKVAGRAGGLDKRKGSQ